MSKNILYTFIVFIILISGFSCGIFLAAKIDQSKNIVKKPEPIEISVNEDNYPTLAIKNTEDEAPNMPVLTEDYSTKEQEIKKIDEPIKKTIKKQNPCPAPSKKYDDMWLLPVGQDTPLDDITYIPKDLKEIEGESSTRNGICLIKEAKDAFELMTNKARDEGYDIKVSSGFRSYEDQKYIISKKIKNGDKNTDIAVAKAGYSEHQLGTAVDVTGQSIKYISASASFEKSPEAKWMEENAVNYGFIESYPDTKQDITGYMYEPWHYRYVGLDNAKEIIKNNQTTIEYLESIKK